MVSKAKFQKVILDYYKKNKRDLPWRRTKDPYKIWISEVMLQQTQADRVMSKYKDFLKTFPNVESLAEASLTDVYKLWQGLGYNRRAKYLRDAAKVIVYNFDGKFPKEDLETLPGIGPYTANAIRVFAYGESAPLLETNVRTVYIHFFFKDKEGVTDPEIARIVGDTISHNPREWFNALMDYGAMLKQEVGNLNAKSKSYTKQSKFKGSDRELRGKILKLLANSRPLSAKNISVQTNESITRVNQVLEILKKEVLVKKVRHSYRLHD